MAIVEVSRNSRVAKTTWYSSARRSRIRVFVKVQSVDDADEDGHPIPTNEGRAGKYPVIAPNGASVFVFPSRMKDVLSLARIKHVKQLRGKLAVVARIPLL